MKKVILLFFISTFANFLRAQELTYEQVGTLTEERTAEILQNSDSLLVYEPGCNGCYWTGDDECNCQRTIYLIWMKESNCKIQKVDCCGVHKLGQVDSTVWNTFCSSVEQIFNTEFKVEYSINHYFFESLNLVTGDSSTQIEIRDYYFSNSAADSTWNMNTPAKVFANELSAIVTNWEESN